MRLPSTLGVADERARSSQGQSVYYKVVVSAGQTLQVGLTSNNASAYNELYVSFGTMPTRSQYGFRYSQPFAANQQVTVPTTQAGAYYILAYGDDVPGGSESVSLEAALVPFSIQAVTPGQAGAGPVTLQISGAQFDFGTTFQLRNSHGDRPQCDADPAARLRHGLRHLQPDGSGAGVLRRLGDPVEWDEHDAGRRPERRGRRR